ncbi:MAG: protein NO VEIN domain-containing protein [Leptospirales bacterium]
MVQEKTGSTWNHEELDLIVEDYFDMLAADLANQSYSKSEHRVALETRIGRSHGSIEFKHQNISAVLEELGLPWIPGYKPRRNYQVAIFGAIDRYLTKNPRVLEIAPVDKQFVESTSKVFVKPPEPVSSQDLPMALHHLLSKFDPVERDRHNRILGKAGEEFVFNLERQRLLEMDRKDLAGKVRWVADKDGDGAGYDILSFDPNGDSERLIEVKTTNGSARTPFFISRNEYSTAKERSSDWLIYRVHLFAKEPRIFTIAPPLEIKMNLRPETWRASF